MLILERFAVAPWATMGKLYLPDGSQLWTVERPWEGNKPRVSCVPCGIYQLRPHPSSRHGETWALVNSNLRVTHYQSEDSVRCLILLHSANRVDELEGCIAPGLALGRDRWSIGGGQSKPAMDRIRNVMKTHPQEHIYITQPLITWP